MSFVIDDDEIMAECIARATGTECRILASAIAAMNEIASGVMPDLIFLDILLDGPDGFTFLNEMVSYGDTGKVPIVVVSSLDLGGKDLSMYGVVGFLNKDIMKPEDIFYYVEQYAK